MKILGSMAELVYAGLSKSLVLWSGLAGSNPARATTFRFTRILSLKGNNMLNQIIKILLAWLATFIVLLRTHLWKYVRKAVVTAVRWVLSALIKFLEELLRRLRWAGFWR